MSIDFWQRCEIDSMGKIIQSNDVETFRRSVQIQYFHNYLIHTNTETDS